MTDAGWAAIPPEGPGRYRRPEDQAPAVTYTLVSGPPGMRIDDEGASIGSGPGRKMPATFHQYESTKEEVAVYCNPFVFATGMRPNSETYTLHPVNEEVGVYMIGGLGSASTYAYPAPYVRRHPEVTDELLDKIDRCFGGAISFDDDALAEILDDLLDAAKGTP